MSFTYGELFGGGGGVWAGITAAGGRGLWSVEYDRKIAGVHELNFGGQMIVDDVCNVDYSALPAVDWLHASPECTRASVANSAGKESEKDRDSAQAVVRALRAASPAVFTLENVWAYRDFDSFGIILQALGELGYMFDFSHVNAADLGVPQTRRRLILRAVRWLLPPLPVPVPWVSWYRAIEDLIPSLPDSELAPWQAERLPADLKSMIFGNHTHTVSGARSWVGADEPMMTVSAQYVGRARAVLVDANNANQASGIPTIRADDAPAFTLTARRSSVHRAVLIDRQNAGRANGSVTIRADDAPAFTVTDSNKGRPLAVSVRPYRVVSMTTRALARFQSVGDGYKLPDQRLLAVTVIGNMVPPLMMQRIAEGLLDHGILGGAA